MGELQQQAKWELFYRLQAELQPTKAAQRARKVVFGGGDVLITPKRKRKVAGTDTQVRKAQRLLWLSGFRVSHAGVTNAAIYRELHIDKTDWYRWRRGEMKDSSSMAQRIKNYLHRLH